jgi:CysZ protein
MQLALIAPALRRAAGQLGDMKILGVLMLSLALMLLVTAPFGLVFVGFAWVIELITPASLTLPWLGQVSFLGVLTKGLVSSTSWVFWTYIMAPVAAGIIGLFLERIIGAVEARHYPYLPTIQPMSMARSIAYALRFFALMILVSLAALIASFFSGPLAPVVFVLANGFLIAREYFEAVALRRMDESAARALEARHRIPLMSLGILLALALAVPFVNLLIPIVGVAAFTHLFHDLNHDPAA